MKVQIKTLGCKMNFVDSERIAKELSTMGFEISEKNPDLIIVNTCTVTDNADKKSLSFAKSALKKGKKVIITGCSVKIEKEKIAQNLPKALIFDNKEQIIEYLKELKEKKSSSKSNIFESPRTRAFVEIQTGCDTYCSYCIVPFTRGPSVNRDEKEIIQEIKELEEKNYKEIVLTGINLASWGASNTNKPEESRFSYLLEQILKKTNIPRIRISSVGAKFLDNYFFDLFSDPRICDHLHISVQSGSDQILAKMNRGHGTKEIISVAERAKKVRPNVALTSDFIVGFPGETEKYFLESENLAHQMGLAKMHVFPFSVRSGTVAEKMPEQISTQIKKERADYLKKVGDKLRKKFIANNLGSNRTVLFENDGLGWTKNYIKTKKLGAEENEIIKIKLSDDNIVF